MLRNSPKRCLGIALAQYFRAKQNAERLHGASTGCNMMYSPRQRRAPPTT